MKIRTWQTMPLKVGFIYGFRGLLTDCSQLDFEQLVGDHIPIRESRWISRASKLYYFFRNPRGKNKKAKVIIPDHWIKRLEDTYKEGNRKLVQGFDLPLEEYGYPL